jgi:hypothetical protein
MADQNPQSPLTGQLSDPNLDPAINETQGIIDKYSYVTGGPNQSLINALTEQSKQKVQQYKQNRADASNMYGQLTQTVDQGINVVQQGYNQAIQESSQNALGATSALGNQLQQQVAQRQAAANELGIGRQAAPVNYESDARMNDAMAGILASNQNWNNLLRAQQQGARQQGVDTKTALGQSKNQTMLALQQALQAGQGSIANQIAAERGKAGTVEMSPMGKILLGRMTTKPNTNVVNMNSALAAFENDPMLAAVGLGKPSQFQDPENPQNVGPVAWQNYYMGELQKAYSNDAYKAGTPIGAQLQTFAKIYGLPAPYIQNAQGVMPNSSYSPVDY